MYAIEKAKTEALLALKTVLGKEYTPTMADLELPRDPAFGDLAFPCFRLAKGLRKNPMEISRELAAKIRPGGLIREVNAEGAYLNFRFETDGLLQLIHQQVKMLGSKYGASGSNKQRIMVEYSGLNTHKPVHIGHARNLLVGASLVRLFRAVGYKVIAADFVNDLGLHVAQCLWGYLKFHASEKPVGDPGKFLGKIYVEAVKYIEEHEEAKIEVAALLKKLEAKDRATMKLWKKTRAWSLADFDRVHAELGAEFDTFYAESDVADDRKKIVDELLTQGVAIKSQGAIIVNLEDVGLGVFVILRSDGTALYSTTDLALALRKFEDYNLQASYYVTDARQKQHFAQLFETLKRFGRQENLGHIAYEFVTLPEGVMSSRHGTVILYDDFHADLLKQVTDDLKARHPNWSARQLKKSAEVIGIGALKFDMLKQDPDKSIIFNIKEALSFEGFSSPYLQYTVARIHGILKKTRKPKRDSKMAAVTNSAERRLIHALTRYPEIIRESVDRRSPAVIARYLFDTARIFAEFYEQVSVKDALNNEKTTHLAVLSALEMVLVSGLKMLGIETLQEM